MKWIARIANWLSGTTKSTGSLGVGLRAALSGGAPGGWASDHREETAHNTGFNYIAIHAIASQVAGATVTVFADGDQQSRQQSRRKSLALSVGSFARWKSIYGADDRETDPLSTTHPLVRLLKRPNPHESGASFRYRQAQQMRLTGTCLVWNVPSVSGQTCERYVIPTSMASPVAPTRELPRGGWRINPVASRYTPIVDDGYVECPSWYRILGRIIDARQVQVIRLPHAWHLDDGQSPLSAGAKWIDAGEAVDEARYHQLKNGIDPSIVWNLPPDVSPDQNEIDRTQAKISSKYGGPENVGRVLVAQSGTTITPLSVSPKEMCYTEGFQDLKAAVLALHQTPPVAVGLQEPGAYAAYNASMKAWRHSAIQPLCDLLGESDTEHLAPQFGTGLTVEIESDTVDDTDLIERQLQNDLAAKVRTKNEWRAVRGMPPLPGSRGEELVGTDGSSKMNNSASPNPDSGPSKESPALRPADNEASNSITNPRVKADQPFFDGIRRMASTANTPFSRSDLKEHANDPIDRTDLDHHQGTSPNLSHDENRLNHTSLIAEILYGLYGSSVLLRLDRAWHPDEKSFDPDLHPHDERGRFSHTGTVSRSVAFISSVLAAGDSSANPKEVIRHLAKLPTSELVKLHEKHGVVPTPDIRKQLKRSVLARVTEFQRSDERTFPNRSQSGKITVHIQNAEKVNARVPPPSANSDRKPLTQKQWGQLVGAQPGATVHVYPSGLQKVEIVVDHHDYLARRTVGGDTINNDFIVGAPRKQKHGIAFRAISQQVKTATELGYKSIEAGGAGKGTKVSFHEENWEAQGLTDPIGYYVWARLGFTGDIGPLMKSRAESNSSELRAIAADFYKKFPGTTDVSQLMLTKVGQKWWLEYGGYFEGRFDLKEGSRSRRILAEYAAEKQGKSKPKSLSVMPHDTIANDGILAAEQTSDFEHGFEDLKVRSDQSSWHGNVHYCENPDPLTAEDEEILDRIWDRIGQETGEEVGSDPIIHAP